MHQDEMAWRCFQSLFSLCSNRVHVHDGVRDSSQCSQQQHQLRSELLEETSPFTCILDPNPNP